jgi:hypothetical protein
MQRRRFVIGILVLVACGLASYGGWRYSRQSEAAKWRPLLIKRMGGESAYRCVAEPDVVTAQRMKQTNPDPVLQPRLAYEPIRDAFEVSPDIQSRLSELLTDPLSYNWEQVAKGCRPNYGIKLTFVRGQQKVEFWVCLSCAAIYVAHGDHAGMIHFDPVENEVIELALRLFPGDSEIEACR